MTTNKNQNKNIRARRRIRPGGFKELGVGVTFSAGLTAAAYILAGSGGALLMAFMTICSMLGLRAVNGPVLFEPSRVEKPATGP